MYIRESRYTILGNENHERWDKPDPAKCTAFQEMDPPQRKEDVPSFISMLTSHSRFIPMFSSLTANIRSLQKRDVKFEWTDMHQKEFDTIKKHFKETTTLSYFDTDLPTWIFVDASYAGLGAILAQGEDIENTNVIAFASRATTPIERRYPQIDLEAMSVDFGLRRFREYCVGAENINVVTDHRPLKAIFENKRLARFNSNRQNETASPGHQLQRNLAQREAQPSRLPKQTPCGTN
jgi:hypothetical protein